MPLVISENKWVEITKEWSATHGSNIVVAADVVLIARKCGMSVANDKDGRVAMGRALMAAKGTEFGRRKIVCTGIRSHARQWKVVRIADAPDRKPVTTSRPTNGHSTMPPGKYRSVMGKPAFSGGRVETSFVSDVRALVDDLEKAQGAIEKLQVQLVIAQDREAYVRAEILSAVRAEAPRDRARKLYTTDPHEPGDRKLYMTPRVTPASFEAPAKPRKKPPIQFCPVPGCKNKAAPVFNMVCSLHKGMPKAKIDKFREARRKAKAEART